VMQMWMGGVGCWRQSAVMNRSSTGGSDERVHEQSDANEAHTQTDVPLSFRRRALGERDAEAIPRLDCSAR
jgi:hypothetical protein